MVGGPVVNEKMQTHLFVVLDILVLSEDPVDDDGQDAHPLVLQAATIERATLILRRTALSTSS